MKKLFILIIAIYLPFIYLNAQNFTQTIKGQVMDKQSQQPMPGVNIIIVGSNPAVGTITDENGNFKLEKVEVGRISLEASFLGYQVVFLNNLNLISGKEMIVNIEMVENVTKMDSVVVKGSRSKAKPNNDMATVSARSFTIEETEKYAGSRGDIARMASNFAGVAFADDQRNDIIIRGNSPAGLLWRLEDVDIPNPNHFAENGTTGGPVSMLNNNVLKNSDFFTGAFPAEYGNALSGVFDLKMRNGNSEKNEFTAESSFNGFELGAEGPISEENQSSYMVYYRYSSLELMNQMGYDFGTAGVPKYQDLSFKINYPLKNGQLTLFGIAGISSIAMLNSNETSSDLYLIDGENIYSGSKMAASGLSYTRFINSRVYAKVIFSGLYENENSEIDTLDNLYHKPFRYLNDNIDEYRASVTGILGTKFSSRFNTKFGFTVDQMGYNLKSEIYNDDSMRLEPYLQNSKKLTDGPQLFRTYYETNFKITDALELNSGLNYIFFTLNNKQSFEPRVGVSWNYAQGRKISFGYGLHSKTQPLSTYYLGSLVPGVGYEETNKDLGFTKSHQFVLGHDWNTGENFRFKSEIYYQYIFNVPVEMRKTAFSMLNTGADWGIDAQDSLVNKGTGYNYGLELTFEKFLSNNYYFLVTTSLFQSKYRGSDDTLRNTAFDGNYVVNLLGGYDYRLNKKWTLGIDIKTSVAGGKRYTGIDEEKSAQTGLTEYNNYQIYANQYPPFFKLDVKFIVRQNMRRVSEEWQIYVENLTNHRNILLEQYSRTQDKVVKVYQLGMFPMILWRLNF